jgi:hypothetical protein
MRHLGLLAVLCGAALLAVPGTASAFEIQSGVTESDPRASLFDQETQQQFLMPNFDGHSLAMPYSAKETDSSEVSDYGNMIAIPAPGVDRPTPAWAGSPFFR